ncbi:MAG: peptide-methionine (R)-S-oxide reductase MsrB [Isosphaeraceae bacterium]
MPSRFRLCLSAAALLALFAAVAARAQDPFQNARPPGSNSDGNAAGKSPNEPSSATKSETKARSEPEFIWKTDAEWRRILTRDQYAVTRLKSTEPAFTGRYSHGHFRGTFLCVCCGAELFDAQTKFESGTGWPSFWRPINERAVGYAVDNSDGEVRTEVMCRRCGAHLGHVFDDGPPPTGLRFCMNSIALRLKPPGGGTANQATMSKSRTKATARSRAKSTAKAKARTTTQTKKTTGNAQSPGSEPADRKVSSQPDQAPSATPDRS